MMRSAILWGLVILADASRTLSVSNEGVEMTLFVGGFALVLDIFAAVRGHP
jgi:hypothetical protein